MTFRVDCAPSWDCRARCLRTRSCPTRRSVTPGVGGRSTGTCASTCGASGLARANTVWCGAAASKMCTAAPSGSARRPWGQQRGWIVPADGSPPQELPQQMVGQKLISWPGTMPEKEPAKHIGAKDHYHRHVLNPEGVSVYVPEGRDAESLPESIKNEIRRQLKGQS